MKRLEKGTEITIKAQGLTVVGYVLTADYWSDREGWYIELIDKNGTYRYWKQRYDGGKLYIDGREADENIH